MDDKIEVYVEGEVSDPGRLIEIHKNVTVEVIEHFDGTVSYGWKPQENTESEYYFYEDNDNE